MFIFGEVVRMSWYLIRMKSISCIRLRRIDCWGSNSVTDFLICFGQALYRHPGMEESGALLFPSCACDHRYGDAQVTWFGQSMAPHLNTWIVYHPDTRYLRTHAFDQKLGFYDQLRDQIATACFWSISTHLKTFAESSAGVRTCSNTQ